MRWLLACQRNGLLRDLMRARGHDAWTNDIEPAEDGSPFHIQADAVTVAWSGEWDAMFACPECRWLCSSGQHRTGKPGQRTLEDVERAVRFFMLMALAPIKVKAIENSVGIMSTRWRKPDQYVQPYQFGDDASKNTGLWLEGLPPLTIDPTEYYPPRFVNSKPRWGNQTDSGQNRLPPGPNRSADRARNYPGIVRAMGSTMKIVWNEARTVGIVVNFPEPTDTDQLAYELRKGAMNSLGLVTGNFVEAWAEMTVNDNCTVDSVSLLKNNY